MDIKKILVPMDFSDCAVNALRFAIELAQKFKASILMMNVSHQPHIHVEAMGAGAILQPIFEDYEKQTELNFKKLKETEDFRSLEVSTQIFSAGFIDAIDNCLKEHDIDIIITGTHENHDFLDTLFGSKSADIINYSSVPVLMIPEGAHLKKVKKIGIAINFDDHNDLNNLQITKIFASTLNAQIIILNITNDSKKLFHHDDDKIALSNYYKDINHLFFTLKDKGDLVNILQNSSKELDLDMLFMHPKKHKGIERLFYKSKTKSMAMKIDIPLLTVHE